MVSIIGDKNSEKNHLGKALAYEQRVPLIDISLDELNTRSSKDIEELLKNISEVRRAVIFLAESLNTVSPFTTNCEKLISFIDQLKNNKGLIILLSSAGNNPKIKDVTEILLQSPNSTIYKQVLDKYATHLTEEGKGLLVEAIHGESISDVIEECKHVEKYWEEHYKSSSRLKAPLKLYLSMVQKTVN